VLKRDPTCELKWILFNISSFW